MKLVISDINYENKQRYININGCIELQCNKVFTCGIGYNKLSNRYYAYWDWHFILCSAYFSNMTFKHVF